MREAYWEQLYSTTNNQLLFQDIEEEKTAPLPYAWHLTQTGIIMVMNNRTESKKYFKKAQRILLPYMPPLNYPNEKIIFYFLSKADNLAYSFDSYIKHVFEFKKKYVHSILTSYDIPELSLEHIGLLYNEPVTNFEKDDRLETDSFNKAKDLVLEFIRLSKIALILDYKEFAFNSSIAAKDILDKLENQVETQIITEEPHWMKFRYTYFNFKENNSEYKKYLELKKEKLGNIIFSIMQNKILLKIIETKKYNENFATCIKNLYKNTNENQFSLYSILCLTEFLEWLLILEKIYNEISGYFDFNIREFEDLMRCFL
ncbi:MAG: hypothetical protein ACLFQV_03010 [Vulcanimicrobiota bacterium]